MPKSIRRSRSRRRSLSKKGGFVRDGSVQHFRIEKKNIRKSKRSIKRTKRRTRRSIRRVRK